MDALHSQPESGTSMTLGDTILMLIMVFILYSSSYLLLESLALKVGERVQVLGGLVGRIVRPVPTINVNGEVESKHD